LQGLKKVEKKKFIEYKKRLEDLDLDSSLYNYFHSLIEEVEREYKIATQARYKGLDPEKEPESIFTWDMAERIEGMIKIHGIADAIRNFSTLSREELAFKLVDMLMEGKFGTYRREDLVDIAVRLAVAILTEGMTVAPLDGIKKVIIKRGRYGEYLSIYYAGPIRSAGGTEAGLSIVYADYIRKKLGLSKYVPTEQEVYRYQQGERKKRTNWQIISEELYYDKVSEHDYDKIAMEQIWENIKRTHKSMTDKSRVIADALLLYYAAYLLQGE